MVDRPAPLRVLVVDDSVVARRYLLEVLDTIAGIETVGSAHDACSARDRIIERTPGVLTLDLNMPGTNGLSFLESLMRWHPMPVIVISDLINDGSHAGACANAVGAVAAVAKPGGGPEEHTRFRQALTEALCLAATAIKRQEADARPATDRPGVIKPS